MKRKPDNNFSCTLDGYMEAREYLQRNGFSKDLARLTGMELVQKANKLIKEEKRSAKIFYTVKFYSINTIRLLRKKLFFRLHVIGGIVYLSLI